MKLGFVVFLVVITAFLIYNPLKNNRLTSRIKKGQVEKAHHVNGAAAGPGRPDRPRAALSETEALSAFNDLVGEDYEQYSEKEFLEGIGHVEMHAPVLEKILNTFNENRVKKGLNKGVDPSAVYQQYVHFINTTINPYLSTVATVCITVFLIMLAVSFTLYRRELYSLIELIGTLGYKLSRVLMLLVSVTAITACLIMRVNLWQDVGYFLLAVPILMLAVSAGLLRAYDFNYPIWNKMIVSFILPVISGIFISVYSI